jgi:hypothetical protein
MHSWFGALFLHSLRSIDWPPHHDRHGTAPAISLVAVEAITPEAHAKPDDRIDLRKDANATPGGCERVPRSIRLAPPE